jgi:hypothetical protein
MLARRQVVDLPPVQAVTDADLDLRPVQDIEFRRANTIPLVRMVCAGTASTSRSVLPGR